MNVQGVIAQAIYKSLQDRQFQASINPGYSAFALFELNNILDEWRDKIPFASLLTFTNISQLTNTKFVSITNVNYVLNQVQTPLTQVSLTEFNATQNYINLTSIPEVYYFDELSQSILVYPLPSNPVYSFTVWGRLGQQPLALTDPLPDNMPQFMTSALIFKLAKRLTMEYGAPWSDEKNNELMRLESLLDNKNDVDLTPERHVLFGRPQTTQPSPFPYFYFLSGGTG